MEKKCIDCCEIDFVNKKSVNKVQAEELEHDIVLRLAETFKVLGDPTRIRIINALAIEELCVCDLAALLDVSQSAVSHQLRLLRNLRLVKFRKEGKIVYYSLDDQHIVNLFKEGLEHVTHD